MSQRYQYEKSGLLTMDGQRKYQVKQSCQKIEAIKKRKIKHSISHNLQTLQLRNRSHKYSDLAQNQYNHYKSLTAIEFYLVVTFKTTMLLISYQCQEK